jgi:hypothetical protein
MELLMRAQEFVREGWPSFLAKTFKAGEPAAAKAATEVGPAIKNIVAPAVLGKPKPEDVTHAYRTMRPAELEHAQATGYFTAKNPDLENRKWWTAHTADPRGIGPLNTNPYSSDIVRVPIDKVPSDTAVNARHAEFWNRETGEWAPVVTAP